MKYNFCAREKATSWSTDSVIAPSECNIGRIVLCSININKNPGPDGYGGGFYKDAWNIIGSYVCAAIHEILHNGMMLKKVNTKMTTLIPMVDGPENDSQFSHIAYFNTLYKCIL